MKKIIVAVMALGMMVSAANAGMKYECWMYKNGKPWKMTYLVADSKSQAETQAENVRKMP